MSYTNQQTSSLADLISKLNTFLASPAAPGWTTVHTPGSGEWSARKTGAGFDVGIATQWDTSSPNHLGIYQWHGAVYSSLSSPWAQNDDSGSGAASTTDATIEGQRHVTITNSPQQFWCFEDDTYFHVVVQYLDDRFEHFGAGVLDKFNDWTGGEYAYGHRQETQFSADVAIQPGTSILLDGYAVDGTYPSPSNMEEFAATLHVEGMDAQVAGGMWASVMGGQSFVNLGTDRQTVPKTRVLCPGGFRAGLVAQPFGALVGTLGAGLMPIYPILILYRNGTTTALSPLGYMKDVRGASIKNFVGGDEVTIGSDTWIIFPSYKRATSDSSVNGTSAWQGIIYKKVTS